MSITWIIIIAMLGAGFAAQAWVRRAHKKGSDVRVSSGLTGAQAARVVLDGEGLASVPVERVPGQLTDHYDPRSRTVRLSEATFDHPTPAAVAIATHEVGHAIQHAQGYSPLKFRSALVPLAQFGSNLSWIFLMVGMLLGAASPLGRGVLLLGIGLFSFAVLFSLITLPVEFDASRRALVTLEEGAYLDAEELGGARKVLRAAAATYVAAAVAALAQLLYFLLRSGLLGGGRREE